MTNTSDFCGRLKAERKKLKLSQAGSAELCGIRPETWSRYEGGLMSPGLKILTAFAAAGADVHYILTGETELERRLKSVKEATDKVANLPFDQDTQAAIVSILYGVNIGDTDTIKDAISIIKGQYAIDFDKASYAFSSQVQNQKMAAEQNPGYFVLCQEQKQLLDNLDHCAPEDQEAIQRMAQLAAKAKRDNNE